MFSSSVCEDKGVFLFSSENCSTLKFSGVNVFLYAVFNKSLPYVNSRLDFNLAFVLAKMNFVLITK